MRGRLLGAEFLGTFLMVLAGTGSIVIDEESGGLSTLGIGIAFGVGVTSAILLVGRISGAHINPAVTLVMAVRGRLSWSLAPFYISAQLAGATAAAIVLAGLFGRSTNLGATLPKVDLWQAFAVELLISFLLVVIVLSAIGDGSSPLPRIAFVIGAYVGAAATLTGPLTGASMNPARSFGPALLSDVWTHHWLYWLAPIAGALAGAWTQARLPQRRPAILPGRVS
jgi:MIP family channel proteins